jgi:hypothetical protein
VRIRKEIAKGGRPADVFLPEGQEQSFSRNGGAELLRGHQAELSMKWLRASLLLQIILAAYFELILWFPLGPWNDQPGKRLIALLGEGHALAVVSVSIVVLLPVSVFGLAVRHRWFWLMSVGFVGYGTWFWLQVQSWWIPWIFGADQRALDNQKFLDHTYKPFPTSTGHPAPDAMHFVLDLLLVSVVLTIALGLLEIRRASRTVSPANPWG